MKRGTLLLAAAAIAVAALAVFPAGADTPSINEISPHSGCDPAMAGTVFEAPEVKVGGATVVAHNYHGFLYCGYRWTSLPIRYRVDTTGAPSAVAAGFGNATNAAASAWNQWWPLNPSSSTMCSGKTLLCADQTTNQVVVRFGALPAGIVGQAAVYSTGKTITGVTVTLNSAVAWKVANGADTVTGETDGVAGTACVLPCASWYDVQDVLTHELGHAIGFEDLGDQTKCGADALEAVDYGQTMYGCLNRGDTSKRTLGWGDQLGLVRLAQDY